MTDVTKLCAVCEIPIGLCVCIKPQYETRDGYIGHPVDYAPSNMNHATDALSYSLEGSVTVYSNSIDAPKPEWSIFGNPGWINDGDGWELQPMPKVDWPVYQHGDLFFVFRVSNKANPDLPWLTVVVYENDLRALDHNAHDIAAHAITSACATAGVSRHDLRLVGGLRG